MRRRSRGSGMGYLPLLILAILLFLWVFGILKIQVSSEVNVPPELQTTVAGLPGAIQTLVPAAEFAIPSNPGTPRNPAAAPPAAPSGVGQRSKASGCASKNSLPDSACTPGAVFANATKEQICVPGYTKTVRDVPNETKDAVYAAYGIAQHTAGEYEVDHLIPLELGGSNDIANLWPEPADPRPGFHEKDKIENYLHDQVCGGALALQQAQTQIATNWVAVYDSMGK